MERFYQIADGIIRLGTHPIEIDAGRGFARVEASFEMRLEDVPGLYLTIDKDLFQNAPTVENTGRDAVSPGSSVCHVRFADISKARVFQADFIGSSWKNGVSLLYLRSVGLAPRVLCPGECHRGLTHLFSGPECWRPRKRESDDPGISGDIEIPLGEWMISFGSSSKSYEEILQHHLPRNRVCAVIEIKRRNGESFSEKEFSDLLEFVEILFSIITGGPSALGQTVAFGESQEPIWELWGVNRLPDRYRVPFSFFSPYYAGWAPEFASGLWKIWTSNQWREPLRRAVGWYTSANDPAGASIPEGRLVMAVTGLDVLTWTYLSVSKNLLRRGSEGDHFGRRLADRIRISCALLNVPVGFPEPLKKIKEVVKQKDFSDLVAAIVQLRNDAVHDKPDVTHSSDQYQKGLTAALYLMDQILMRLIDYKGPYYDRAGRDEFGRNEVFPDDGA